MSGRETAAVQPGKERQVNGVNDRMILAKQIRSYRKACLMTQKELADALDVKEVTICRWERGLSKPSWEEVKTLEALLQERHRRLYPHFTYDIQVPSVKPADAGPEKSGPEPARELEQKIAFAHKVLDEVLASVKI